MSDPLEVITRLEELERAAREEIKISRSRVEWLEYTTAIQDAAPALLKALRCLISEMESARNGHFAVMHLREATDAALKELSEVKL